jgi:hypothetical protein
MAQIGDITVDTLLDIADILVDDAPVLWKEITVQPLPNAVRVETGLTYLIVNTDWFIILDATSNNITCSLPASALDGERYIVKRIDNSVNTVVVDTADASLIDGLASVNLTQNDSFTFYSNGTNWYVQ